VENRYEIIIFWSEEDQAFVADVPELPGCMAHGASYEEALRNTQEAISLWIDTARVRVGVLRRGGDDGFRGLGVGHDSRSRHCEGEERFVIVGFSSLRRNDASLSVMTPSLR
jgi:predicted RNase H-like HicB family nuclease